MHQVDKTGRSLKNNVKMNLRVMEEQKMERRENIRTK